MTNLLQRLYIVTLNPLYALTGKINGKARTIIIQILCFCFPVFFILRHANILYGHFSFHETQCQILGSLLILLIIVFSINAPLHTVEWKKSLLYPILITGICIIIISFIHTIGSGYRAFGLMLIIVYPCLFFVWNNRADYEGLFIPLSKASCVVGFLLLLYCCYQSYIGEFVILPGNRCAGPLGNANSFSMMGMIAFCAALYLFVACNKSKLAFVFNAVSLGAGFAIVILGQSRISFMACIVSFLATVFFYFRYCKRPPITILLIKIIIAFNMILLSLLAAQCIIVNQQSTENNVTANVSAPVQSSQEDTSVSSAIDRFDTENTTDINAFSSGRIVIWQSYAQHLNMIGNDFDSIDWNTIAHDPSHHAHNNFLEMALRFGVPVGILYLLIEVIAGIIALSYLFANRNKYTALLFPIIIMIMFVFESMLEVATLTFERIVPCYFYFALIPMVDATINKKQ